MTGIQPFTPRTNRLLAALEPDDFGLLAPNLETVELKHRQVLYDTGATMRWASFPHDAIVSLVNEFGGRQHRRGRGVWARRGVGPA